MIGDPLPFEREAEDGERLDAERRDELWGLVWECAELDEPFSPGRGPLRELVESSDGDAARTALAALAEQGQLGEARETMGELHLALDRALADEGITVGEGMWLRRRLIRLRQLIQKEEIGAQLRMQTDLLRDITHDLRVPLNSIVFLTDSLFEERHGDLNETQRRQLGGVYSASATLLNLVNDLLDLTRSTRDELESTSVPFSIDGVLEDVRHLVRPVAQHHRAELDLDVRSKESWHGDPRLVRRLLLNLVTNGLEAAGEGGTVSVRVESAESGPSDREMPTITVEDSGGGLDFDRAEKLLHPGELSGWKNLLDGTDGLGLLICGRLVRAAGGSISVERRQSRGTRFVVELPYGAEDAEDSEGASG